MAPNKMFLSLLFSWKLQKKRLRKYVSLDSIILSIFSSTPEAIGTLELITIILLLNLKSCDCDDAVTTTHYAAILDLWRKTNLSAESTYALSVF
jgi:hypothetical protein